LRFIELLCGKCSLPKLYGAPCSQELEVLEFGTGWKILLNCLSSLTVTVVGFFFFWCVCDVIRISSTLGFIFVSLEGKDLYDRWTGYAYWVSGMFPPGVPGRSLECSVSFLIK
jgi:hypothetical protein